MNYIVAIKPKVLKDFLSSPKPVQRKFHTLVKELMLLGPYRVNWPNYSPLSTHTFHCHLAMRWVACWRWKKSEIEIEVYYAGSREKAPY
jgi:mRNA-degrading endonuclease RelE of RelBE toxin-antitoxin system